MAHVQIRVNRPIGIGPPTKGVLLGFTNLPFWFWNWYVLSNWLLRPLGIRLCGRHSPWLRLDIISSFKFRLLACYGLKDSDWSSHLRKTKLHGLIFLLGFVAVHQSSWSIAWWKPSKLAASYWSARTKRAWQRCHPRRAMGKQRESRQSVKSIDGGHYG